MEGIVREEDEDEDRALVSPRGVFPITFDSCWHLRPTLLVVSF